MPGCAPPQPRTAAQQPPPQRPPAPNELAGTWVGVEDYGPAIRGDVLVDGRGATWKARIGGMWIDATHAGNEVRFELPGNGGFRGGIDADGRIRGHWTQPGGLLSGMRFATPVELVADRAILWRGTVATLESKLHYFVHVRASADGALTAVIRNPERNLLGNRLFELRVAGSDVTLTSTRSLAWSSKAVQIEGRYDAARDRLFLKVWGPTSFELELERAATTLGFTARDQIGAPYTYRAPEQLADGWSTAALDDTGIESAPIVALVRAIIDADPDAIETQAIHSLLIARRGKLVVEEYFYGFDRDRAHDLRSATKTIAPMLVGVARDHGAKLDATTRVYDLYASKYAPFANWDERKRDITVEHFMTMRTGLACDDNDPKSPGEEDNVSRTPDWYRTTLDLPLVTAPGGKTAVYCTASTNMVGGIAEQASGVWNAELFERYLARPLQFGRYYLNLTPMGPAHTGGMAYLRRRDFLKLGQLYLNGGMWNGKQVIARDWVERSIQSHGAFGDDPEPLAAHHEYGYGWHIFMLPAHGRTYRSYHATGNGGQLLIVVPGLELAVVVTGGNYATPWFRWGMEMIPRHVLAAAHP
jgi:CubicO group peptidase (beta-lactamase class C family)